MNEHRLKQAEKLRQAAKEFEKAKQHCLIAADHFEVTEVPRGCAHNLASIGHAESAQTILKEVAVQHSKKAKAEA